MCRVSTPRAPPRPALVAPSHARAPVPPRRAAAPSYHYGTRYRVPQFPSRLKRVAVRPPGVKSPSCRPDRQGITWRADSLAGSRQRRSREAPAEHHIGSSPVGRER